MCGCSLFVPATQQITIDGEPAGAKVIVNGRRVTTPATVEVKRNAFINIEVSKEGYEPQSLKGSFGLSPLGILDLLGGFVILVPFIGFASPGAFQQDQENFYFTLVKVEK